jgi:hypothetical protein
MATATDRDTIIGDAGLTTKTRQEKKKPLAMPLIMKTMREKLHEKGERQYKMWRVEPRCVVVVEQQPLRRFDGVDAQTFHQMCLAVKWAAARPGLSQPVILCPIGHDEDLPQQQLLYWPSDVQIGLRVLQSLHTMKRDSGRLLDAVSNAGRLGLASEAEEALLLDHCGSVSVGVVEIVDLINDVDVTSRWPESIFYVQKCPVYQ